MARNAKADPYYELTERMGKGRPFAEYTAATAALKRELAAGGGGKAPRRRATRRNPRLGTVALIGAALLGGYELLRRKGADASDATGGSGGIF